MKIEGTEVEGYEFHPAADVFPLMEGAAFQDLVKDIKEHGLREPIARVKVGETYLVLDGRNRFRACVKAEVDPEFYDYEGDDHFEYAWSVNIPRRHLNPGQQASLRLEWELQRKEWHEQQVETQKAANKARSEAVQTRDRNEDGTLKTSSQSGTTLSPTGEKEKKKEEKKTRSKLAKSAGTSVGTAQKAITVQKEDPELHKKVVKGEVTLNQAYRTVTKNKVVEKIKAEPQPPPEGPFRVIVADPPWAYEKHKDDGTQRGQTPYPTMTSGEIMDLVEMVDGLAHEDCILWLWTTNAHLPVAFEVLDVWGFEYKTCLTWLKSKMGTGDWLRGITEHCLLAVRGKPTVNLTNETTLIEGETREHSRKPKEFYELVEKLCPGSKLEMFATDTSKEGWQFWSPGNWREDNGI